jgi:hypothetical protein
MIPRVVASETGRAQTEVACSLGVVGPHLGIVIKQDELESSAIAGESPLSGN